MHKLYEDIKKELREIDENGININNLDVIGKLVDIAKDICEIKNSEDGERTMREYGDNRYMGGNYNIRGSYDGNYNTPYMDNYMRGRGGRYSGMDPRMTDHINRIMEDSDMYQYGRQRYRESGSREQMTEGLENLMYSLCNFIKGIEDFVETPEEKEIIRKHISKLKM